MLALARDRAAGAHCYKVSVAHTAQAREIMGPGAFLGVEHAVLFETDPARARAVARAHLAAYLAGQYNAAKFRRLGYTEQDLSDGGSDRFVDDFVFWGDLDTIVAKLKAHVDAGADHVAIQVIGINPGQTAMPYWRMLSDALLPQRVSALPPRTATLGAVTGRVIACAAARRGLVLLTGDKDTVRAWDAADGRQLWPAPVVNATAVSTPDGNFILLSESGWLRRRRERRGARAPQRRLCCRCDRRPRPATAARRYSVARRATASASWAGADQA
jgi:hypothetical protein